MRYQELNRTRLHTRWCRQRAPTTKAFVGCHFICTAVLSTSCIFPFCPVLRTALALMRVKTAPDSTVLTLSQVLITAAIAAVNRVLHTHTQGVEYCNRKGIPHISHLCWKFPLRVAFPLALASVPVRLWFFICSFASVTSSPSSQRL